MNVADKPPGEPSPELTGRRIRQFDLRNSRASPPPIFTIRRIFWTPW